MILLIIVGIVAYAINGIFYYNSMQLSSKEKAEKMTNPAFYLFMSRIKNIFISIFWPVMSTYIALLFVFAPKVTRKYLDW